MISVGSETRRDELTLPLYPWLANNYHMFGGCCLSGSIVASLPCCSLSCIQIWTQKVTEILSARDSMNTNVFGSMVWLRMRRGLSQGRRMLPGEFWLHFWQKGWLARQFIWISQFLASAIRADKPWRRKELEITGKAIEKWALSDFCQTSFQAGLALGAPNSFQICVFLWRCSVNWMELFF
jgi:hypothetical protein